MQLDESLHDIAAPAPEADGHDDRLRLLHGFIATLGMGLIISGYLATNYKGSYGEAPHGYRLPAATRLGPVRLQVADLARSLAFYEGVLGMRAVARDESHAVLAAQGDDAPLVELQERAGARRMTARGRLGLFHFAILLPNRPSLGRFVRHLAEIGARAGAADHLVSEALYLRDPDGNGVELYWDRPQAQWPRTPQGEIAMFTRPLDLAGLLGEITE